MKIALIGYGKMGKMIEQAAVKRGHSVISKVDSKTSLTFDSVDRADICFEFTNPQSTVSNIEKLAKFKKNIIIGTTGWHENLDHIKHLVEQSQIGALYSPNFSIGVCLLMKILDQTSQLMQHFSDYDVSGVECHHRQKVDTPSGTSKEISSLIRKNIDRIDNLSFASVRCGSIPGTHTVYFDSPADTITITHTARSRQGFALGAIQAAEWLQGKKGFYSFQDFLHCMISRDGHYGT